MITALTRKKYSDEALFCAKYLQERGFLAPKNVMEMKELIKDFDGEFKFIKVEKSFYAKLAQELRELWPTGEKDGKYPWRDSVENLTRRLETLWAARNLGKFSIDTCLTVARRYLAQYRDNVKYMQTLKYFILKQGRLEQGNGKIKYIQQSLFADMLQNVTDEDKQQAEWESAFEQSNTIEQGGVLV